MGRRFHKFKRHYRSRDDYDKYLSSYDRKEAGRRVVEKEAERYISRKKYNGKKFISGVKSGSYAIAGGAKVFTGKIKKAYVQYQKAAPQRRRAHIEKLRYEAEVSEQKARIAQARAATPRPQMPSLSSEFSGIYGAFVPPPQEFRQVAPQQQAPMRAPELKRERIAPNKKVDFDKHLRRQILG